MEASSLYHEAILRYARAGHGAGRLTQPDKRTATIDNPLCGDRVRIDALFDAGGTILATLALETRGCVLCEAAASILGERARDRPLDELRQLQAELKTMLTVNGDPPPPPWDILAMFQPVRPHRARHDCVLLPFEALAHVLAPKNERMKG